MSGQNSTLEQRFWAKVVKTDGCWIWNRGKGVKRYGSFKVGRSTEIAHRFSWKLHRGPIPDGLNVLHHCDNTRCVRPDHLFLGTQADNVADMIGKGRDHKAKGERAALSKLTEAQVREMRRRYVAGVVGCHRLAAEYGVRKGTVQFIIARKTWKHIE